jgi:hypothetical protein
MQNGQQVLDDPDALAVFRAVQKHNCIQTCMENHDRIVHFARRIAERGLTFDEVVITVLNVDDPHGGPVAEMLMPGHPWDEYRARGEVPFARGLAAREGIQSVVDEIDSEAGEKLRNISPHGGESVIVVVMDHGVVEIFTY